MEKRRDIGMMGNAMMKECRDGGMMEEYRDGGRIKG